MANVNLKDGLKSGQITVESISGNLLATGKTIQMSEVTFLIQSGNYETQKSAGVPNPTVFATPFAAAPVVVMTPTQAAGLIGPPIANAIVASGFNASGGNGHTGTYIAFGIATGIST